MTSIYDKDKCQYCGITACHETCSESQAGFRRFTKEQIRRLAELAREHNSIAAKPGEKEA